MTRFTAARVEKTRRSITGPLEEMTARDDRELVDWQILSMSSQRPLVVMEYEEVETT